MTTRNLVPRADNEGSLGTSSKKWADVNATSGGFSTLKVSSLKLNVANDLSLFTNGAGIETIDTNNEGQFVIALDDAFVTSLGFNADGTKPDFAANGTVLAGDSFVSAINKLDQAVSNVADPANLDIDNFNANTIQLSNEVFADNDTTLMTSAAINDRIESFGYTTNIGDITGVTAGTGLSGGGESGAVTLNIADTLVTPGSYGSATAVPTFTVDQQGRLTAAGTAAISTTLTVDSDGPNSADVSLTDDDLQILGGTGLTSSIAKANNEVTLTVALDNTAVTAAAYGSATAVPTFTVDQQGRLTAAADVNIAIGKGQVTNFDEEVQDIVGGQLVTNGSHSGLSAVYDDNGDGAIDLSVSVAEGNIQNSAVTSAKLNDNVISGLDATTDALVDADLILVSDTSAGSIKKSGMSDLKTYMQNNLNFVDVSVDNLATRLGQIDSNIQIGADNTVQVTIPGNLVVTGTTTTNHVETVSTTNGVVFEGNNADDHEVTLLAASVTADRTVTLPDLGGHIPLLEVAATETITSTPAELNLLDGSGANQIANSKAVIYSAAGNVNATSFTGALTGNVVGNVTGDLTGNADTASTWATARTITLGGDLTGNVSLDGSQDVTLTATIAELSVTSDMLAGSINDTKLEQDYVQTSEVDDSSIEWDGTSLQVKAAGITNAMLAGSIADGKLEQDYIQTSEVDDSSIEFSGGSLNVKALGITNAMLAGNIAAAKLDGSILDSQLDSDYIQTSEVDDSSIEFSGGSLNVKASGITNAMLAGSIANDKLLKLTGENKVDLSALDIDGGTLSGALIDSDLIIVDNGADGTNRKSTLSQLATWIIDNNSINSLSSLAGVGTITAGTWNAGVIADDYVSNTLTITGGSIDNVAIGETTRSSGKFTTLDASNSLKLNDITITGILDEDTLASNSATSLATQQSIKAYVDNSLSGHCLFVEADNIDVGGVDNNLISLNLAGEERLQFVGGTGIDTAASEVADVEGENPTNDTVTISIDNTVVATLTDTQTLTNKTLTSPTVSGLTLSDSSIIFEGSTDDEFETTLSVEDPTADRTITLPDATDTLVGRATTDTLTNKTIDADDGTNSISNLQTSNLKAGVLDTDLSAVAADDTTLASAKAIKTYVDQQLGRFGGIFLTDSVDNNHANDDYNRDVIFDSSPLVRSHFGPFAFDLGQLHASGGSDIIFYGATATGASDRHFLVIGSGDDAGDTKFTGANENTP